MKKKVIFPDGSVGEVDEKDLQSALAAGAKLYSETPAKKRQVTFADNSTGEIDEADYESALKSGFVKKKDGGAELPISVSPYGVDTRNALAPQSSRNPYAGVFDISTKLGLSPDATTNLYNKTANGDVRPLVDIVKKLDADLAFRKETRKREAVDKSEANVNELSGFVVYPDGNEQDNVFAGEEELVKNVRSNTAKLIDAALADRLNNSDNPFYSAKQLGDERRRLRSEIGEEIGYQDEVGDIEAVKTLKNKFAFGIDIPTKEKETQQIHDYINEKTIYESALNNLDKELQSLEETPQVQEFNKLVNEDKPTPEQRQRFRELQSDPTVNEYIRKFTKGQNFANRLEQLPRSYPTVLVEQRRQQLANAWANRVLGEDELANVIPGNQTARQLRKIFVGDKPSSDEDYEALSKETGIPVEDVKMLSEAPGSNIGVPSRLGRIWNSAQGVLGSTIEGVNRLAYDPNEANVINKQLDRTRYKPAQAIQERDWSVDKVLDTMADGLGQFTGYAVGAELIGLPFTAAGSAAEGLGAATQIGRTAATRIPTIIRGMEKAKSIGGTIATGYLSSFEDAYQYAATQTDDESKRQDYAKSVAVANGLSELILRDVDVAGKILKGKNPEEVLSRFLRSETPFTTGDVLKARMGEFAKTIGYESLEELIPYFTEVFQKDNVFGNKLSASEVYQGALDTIVQTAISTVPMGAFSSLSVPTQRVMESALLEAAKTPARFNQKWEELYKKGEISEQEMNNKIKVTNTVADIYKKIPNEINGEPVSEEQKGQLINLILGKRQLSDQKQNVDESLHGPIDQQISDADKKIGDVVSGRKDNLTVKVEDNTGTGATVESAVIEIGGKQYEGKNHAEAILKAQADGQDISNVDRQAQGLFKLSDGTFISRKEAKNRFGQDRAELLIEQDDASKQANAELEKQSKDVSGRSGEVVDMSLTKESKGGITFPEGSKGQPLFNFDNPLAQKKVGGVTYRITDEGLENTGRKVYRLYKDKELIGEYFNVEDAKKYILQQPQEQAPSTVKEQGGEQLPSSTEPKVTEQKTEQGSLFDRVKEKVSNQLDEQGRPTGIYQLIGEQETPEGMQAIKEQALDAPASLADQLGGDEQLVNDILDQATTEELESASNKLANRVRNDKTLSVEEADRHSALLESAMERKQSPLTEEERLAAEEFSKEEVYPAQDPAATTTQAAAAAAGISVSMPSQQGKRRTSTTGGVTVITPESTVTAPTAPVVIQPGEPGQAPQTEGGVTVIRPTNEIELFADRIIRGERLDQPNDQEFYVNNADAIEAELKRRFVESAGKAVPSEYTPEERKKVSDALFDLADKISGVNETGSGGASALSNLLKVPKEILAGLVRAVAKAVQSGENLVDAIRKVVAEYNAGKQKDEPHIDEKDFEGYIKSVLAGQKPKAGSVFAKHVNLDVEGIVPGDQAYLNAIDNPEPKDPIASYNMSRDTDIPKMFGSDLKQQELFDSLPSDERFRAQMDMLQDGKSLIAAAQGMFGSTDVAVYGPELFRYIQNMPAQDTGLTNKKAVLLATLLGEIKQALYTNTNPNTADALRQLDGRVSSYYNRFMHVTAKNLAAGRLLRLFRDKYMADIFTDTILEEDQVDERNNTKDAEASDVSDEEAVQHEDKPKQKADEKKAKAARSEKKKKEQSRKKGNKDEYSRRAKEKEDDIKDKYGSKDNLVNSIIDRIKKINCK